ncbi:MAG: hypothetical protein U5O39_12920 [Gammaproteobacteria bacterium]|nr:hypothetical protein [Gammaproteobacteria bacterium]
MLAHDPATNNMTPMELLGNVILLIVGGNDTTRNSISGGLLALNENPKEYEKLLQNPGLVPKIVPEIVAGRQFARRHMARTALTDFELGGKQIREGLIASPCWFSLRYTATTRRSRTRRNSSSTARPAQARGIRLSAFTDAVGNRLADPATERHLGRRS